MLPKLLTIGDVNSDWFKDEFQRGERHLVCLAANSLTLFNAFTGGVLLTLQEGNDLCALVQERDATLTCFTRHNIAMSLLPLQQLKGGAYGSRSTIARSIEEAFRLNRDVVRAPKMSFLFEPNRFDSKMGIETMFHYATSTRLAKDRLLQEISYIDTNDFKYY